MPGLGSLLQQLSALAQEAAVLGMHTVRWRVGEHHEEQGKEDPGRSRPVCSRLGAGSPLLWGV